MQERGFFFLDINNAFPDSLIESNFHAPNASFLVESMYNRAKMFFEQPFDYKNESYFGEYGTHGFQPVGIEYQVCIILHIYIYINAYDYLQEYFVRFLRANA